MAQIPATQTWTDGEIVTASDMEDLHQQSLEGTVGQARRSRTGKQRHPN